MKKLLTMIGAAAAAFGLYADTTITSTSFEDASEFNEENALVIGESTDWSCLDSEAKLLKGEYDEDNYKYTSGNVRYGEFDSQTAFLNVKTTFGKPLTRAFTEAAVADGAPIYFDQLVKFTACDEAPTTEYEDAKILVYVQDLNADQENAEPNNHLMVKAGQYTGSDLAPAVYDLGALKDLGTLKQDIDAWHRITIKAINADGAQKLGFVVYVDAEAIPSTTVAGFDAAAAASLTPNAFALNAAKKIFPSMVKNATVSSVSFDGQGAIDDLMVTDVMPGDWAEDKNVTVTWDEHVTALSYSIDGVETPIDISAAAGAIPYIENKEITLIPTFDTENGWAFDKLEGDNFTVVDGAIFTADNEDAEVKVVSKDTTERVTVTIGGEDMAFPQLAQAFAYINAQSEEAKVVLQEDATLGTTTIDGVAGVTEGTITGDAAVEIDLNGCTITGPDSCTYGYTLDVATTGGLKITDSSELKNGKILASNEGAITCYGCKLTIDAGIIDGKVMLENADSEISGGSFIKSTEFGEEDGKLHLKDGYQVVEGETYNTVEKIPTAGFTVRVAGTTHTEDVELYVGETVQEELTAEVAVGDVVKVVAGAADYYEYAAAPEGGWSLDAGVITYTKTITASDLEAGDLGVTVPEPTAKEYTFSYMDTTGEEPTVFATETYTVETEALTLNPGTKQGYDFVGWYFDPEFVEDSKIADGADLLAALLDNLDEPVEAVFGKWTAKQPVAQITGSDTPYYSLADAVAAAEAGNTITVIADTTETNVYAKVDLTVVNNAVVTFVSEGAANYSFQVQNNAQVTLSGTGTWVKGISNSSSMFQVVAFTTGKLTVNSGTFIGGEEGQEATIKDSPSNLVQAKGGSLEINGGTFTNYRLDVAGTQYNGHCVCAEGTNELGQATTAVVNGGTFTAMNIGAIPVYAKEGGKLTITGPSEAKFNQDESDYCADGYETKLNEESGLWEVVKKASPYIDPTKPTELDIDPSDPEAETKAQAAADAMDVGGKPADEIVTKEAWNAYFNKVAKYDEVAGKWVAEATLTDEVVKAEAETAEIAAELTDADFDGTFNLTNAKPGLYYSLNQGNTVERGTTTTPVRAGAERTVELVGTKYENAGFYQIIVSPVAE